MGGILLTIKSWWDGADRTQRTVAIVGGGFLALLMVVTYLFASKPHMGMLVSGLNGADQGSVIQELQKRGVPYEMDMNGNISVPSDKIAELRAQLMSAGKLPMGTSAGISPELEKVGSFQTPRVQREQLKSIAEAQLADNVDHLDGVESAVVHLALADDSPFVTEKKGNTASVTVFERAGSELTKEQARGIAMLIASSVPNLDPNGVTVLNRRGEAIIDPTQDSGPGQANTKLATERLEAKRREHEIQSKLDAAFGPGNTIATVDLELNFKAQKVDEVQTTPQPVVVQQTTEKMTGGTNPLAANGGGTAGVGANIGAPAAVTGAGVAPAGEGYENKHVENDTVFTDTKSSHMEDPAGDLSSMTISVIVNSDKVKDPAPVKDWVQNYLGAHANDKNFVANVTSTKFDTTAATEAAKASQAEASRDRMQQILSLLPVGALVIVAVMVLKAIGKFAKTQTLVVSTPDGRMIPLPSSGLNISEAALGGGGGAQLTTGQGKSSVGSGGSAPSLSRGNQMLEEDDPEVDSIKRKINVPLEQIKKMSDERPEVVAMLIKTWLMEERR